MGAVPKLPQYFEKIDAKLLESLDFYLDCGNQDLMVRPSTTVEAGTYLESIGANVTWELHDGGHNSALYMDGMPKSMAMHSQHFIENGLAAYK
jgi:predicted esterase